MKVECPYCGSTYESDLDKCPGCSAPNESSVAGNRIVKDPVTIEELQEWYNKRNLPPKEVTRFFIGEDYRGAKAFGIYRDPESGNVIVYKNKADGSRAVRYEGRDEAVAVREILAKLRETISLQKKKNAGDRGARRSKKRKPGKETIMGFAVFVIIAVISFAITMNEPDRGYYRYHDDTYYNLDGGWYLFDRAVDDWVMTSDPFNNGDSWKDYYESTEVPSGEEVYNFEDTEFYSDWEEQQQNSTDDDDYDWDSGDSWDSDAGDWDSDW